jgi:hypothetical protein
MEQEVTVAHISVADTAGHRAFVFSGNRPLRIISTPVTAAFAPIEPPARHDVAMGR